MTKIQIKIKLFINYMLILIRYKFSKHEFNNNSKNIYIHFTSPNNPRYLYLLIKILSIGDFNIRLFNSYKLLSTMIDYEKEIYLIENLKLDFWGRIGDADIVITDNNKIKLKENNVKNYIVNCDYYSERLINPNIFLVPFPMHPIIYQRNYYKEINELRKNERDIHMFFYENFLKSHYENPILNTLFNKLNRQQIKEALNVLDSQYSEVINTMDDYTRGRFKNKLMRANFRVNMSDWLNTLSKCNFFIAASGVQMPNCHNIIEAMAVGTIPITEYPELFSPPLEDKINCIKFTSADDLINIIKQLSFIPFSEVVKMRTNVIIYYEEHLKPESFAKKLINNPNNLTDLFIISEGSSVAAFQKQQLIRAD